MTKDELLKLFGIYDSFDSFDGDENEPHTFSVMLGEDPEILTDIANDTNAMKTQIYNYYPDLAKYKIKNIESAFYMHEAYYIFEICSRLSFAELKKSLSQYENSDNTYRILD